MSARSVDRAILIGGCGRSGTTVFRECLNRHSRIACGPETSMFGLPFNPSNIGPYWEINVRDLARRAAACPNLVAFAEQFYRDFLQSEGKARWADKTPNNVRAIAKLLTWFPNGTFIHLIRDGRDVVCSLRHMPKAIIVKDRIVPVNVTNAIPECAERWLRETCTGIAFRGHPRYIEVRYEDLTSDPERELRRVCDFLGEPFEPQMLVDAPQPKANRKLGQLLNNPNAEQPITNTSVGRWRRDLKRDERQAFVNIAGELLITLGYAQNHDWVSETEASAVRE